MDRTTPADVAKLRREYRQAGLSREDLDPDPIAQFRRWLTEAMDADLPEPNAMVLATSDGSRCSSRTVLLKAFDQRGFVFFTNYGSRKASDIAAQDQVSLLFPWYAIERQVGILGRAERISAAESLAYFASRPRGSRLGAWVSAQSSVIDSRRMLEMQWQAMQRRFASGEIPLPSFWGGYRVQPLEIEFWQGRENRLHDRFRYLRGDAQAEWRIERLAP
ncbi:pyridoxamine 5'-phosphate oxidase [Cyanobium sp. FGCU-52]|nr:pyridoxamine 5'-phosphate oxidase [Cyanobium sp. FGCU52]